MKSLRGTGAATLLRAGPGQHRRPSVWALGELPFGYNHQYTYSHLGYNLKITDMQAAVGLGQLDRLDGFIAERKRNYGHLRAGLARFGTG